MSDGNRPSLLHESWEEARNKTGESMNNDVISQGHSLVTPGAFIAPQTVAIVDVINTVINWNRDAGNSTDKFNIRQSAMYLGLQCEELAEKLKQLGFGTHAYELDQLGNDLKKGKYDHKIHDSDRLEMLDADMDLIVVSVGAAMSQGADVNGAMAEVLRSNDSKRDAQGRLNKDTNGKIIKDPGYSPADLTPYLLKLTS